MAYRLKIASGLRKSSKHADRIRKGTQMCPCLVFNSRSQKTRLKRERMLTVGQLANLAIVREGVRSNQYRVFIMAKWIIR